MSIYERQVQILCYQDSSATRTAWLPGQLGYQDSSATRTARQSGLGVRQNRGKAQVLRYMLAQNAVRKCVWTNLDHYEIYTDI